MGANIGTETLDIFKNDWIILSDFIDFFCGDCIGTGNSRTVYEFRPDPKMVIKIDRSNGQFFNVSEWDLWHNTKEHHPKLSRFLAPCVRISNAGKIMIQHKTTPLEKPYKGLPENIPSFISDTKIQNWGKIGNRIVCHDYANHYLYKNTPEKLVKAKWWSESYQWISKKERDVLPDF